MLLPAARGCDDVVVAVDDGDDDAMDSGCDALVAAYCC